MERESSEGGELRMRRGRARGKMRVEGETVGRGRYMRVIYVRES